MPFLGVITPKKGKEKSPPPSLPFGSAQREGGVGGWVMNPAQVKIHPPRPGVYTILRGSL